MGVSIYGFDYAKEITPFIHFIIQFSFVRISWISFVLCDFGLNRKRLNCDQFYCHFGGDPREILKYLDFDQISMMSLFWLLLLNLIFFRILAFFILNVRCKIKN